MAGFLTRRLSREHRKLVKQNELASAWLENLNATAAKLGLSDGNGELLVTIANFRMIIDEAKMQLATTDILSAESASKNVDVNRQLRRIYDESRGARKQFKRQYGTVMNQPMEKFDNQFEPSEGWKSFLSAN